MQFLVIPIIPKNTDGNPSYIWKTTHRISTDRTISNSQIGQTLTESDRHGRQPVHGSNRRIVGIVGQGFHLNIRRGRPFLRPNHTPQQPAQHRHHHQNDAECNQNLHSRPLENLIKYIYINTTKKKSLYLSFSLSVFVSKYVS